MATCERCGALLEPDGAACPNCGRVAGLAPPGPGVLLGILAGLAAGGTLGALGIMAGLTLAEGVAPSGNPGCTGRLVISDAYELAVLALVIATFVVTLRRMRPGPRRLRPFAAAALLTTAIVVLLPAGTCGVAVLAFSRCS